MSFTCIPALLLAGIIVSIQAPLAHAASREIRASIRDPWGNPVPGACLYVEAWTGNGEEYDFAFARAGARGEIPADGTAPATISWRRGARLTYLVLEADREPVLIFDRDRHLDPGALEFRLEDLHPDRRPDLRGLGYPFDGQPELSRRLADPRLAPLRSLLGRYLPAAGTRLFALEPGYRRTGSERPRLYLSALGRGAACAWVREKDGRHFVQAGGRVLDGHEMVLDVVLSPDGERIAFCYLKKRTQLRPGIYPAPHLTETTRPVYVNLDNEKLGPYASVYDLGFSDDGRHAWFSFEDPEGRKGVFADGKPLLARVSEIDAAEDGSYVSWVVERGGKRFVHVNGRDWGGYDRILHPPGRTPDGAHVWFRALEAGRVVVWVDGRVLGPFEDAGAVTFLPGGDGFWFTVKDGARTLLYVDGHPRGELTADRQPLIGPDGSAAGFVRRSRDQWFVDLGRETLGGFEELGPIRFSPDGARYGFAYTDGTGHFLCLGGKRFGLPLDRMSSFGQAVFSDDLSRGAFSFEREGRAFVLVDGREIPAGECVTRMGFSPDAGSFWFLSYVVRDGRRRTSLRVNDQVLGDYDFADPPDFSKDGRRFWFRYTRAGEDYIHSAGADRRLAAYLGAHWLRTSPDRSRWAVSYVQDYPANDRRLIDLDGTRMERAIEAEPDHGGFEPHALALLPSSGAALLTLDPKGAVRRQVLDTPGPGASPSVEIRLPKQDFVWGEAVPLKIALRNPTARPLVREDPARSTKTLLRLVRKKDGKRLSLTLSGVSRVDVWNGRGPYPVPALRLAPGARLDYEVDLIERFVRSPGQAALLQPDAGEWDCHVQDRGQESAHLLLRLRLAPESIPLLLAILRDQRRDRRMRAWAMSWLRAVVDPHVRGYFTEAAPWECVDPKDRARAEKALGAQLDRYQRWWAGFGRTEEAASYLQGLGR
ncbi:MAG: hypothetical protein JXR96_00355 [Deltaproteobacteria bacterium]|nr:hypothetical protein [Deltaproteobacteria bacterium]